MAKKTIPIKIKNKVLDYINYLKEEGLPIEDVGSYAQKKNNHNSDIDVCVVLKGLKGKDPLVYLWSKKRKNDIKAMLSPVGFESRNFVNEDPLVWEIKTS